jgi:signal transduction histidine kinase
VKGTAFVHKHLYGEELPHKTFKMLANMARNSIKPLDSDEDLTVTFDSKEEMIDMLVRATDNFYGLEIPESNQVKSFNEWYMSNVVSV